MEVIPEYVAFKPYAPGSTVKQYRWWTTKWLAATWSVGVANVAVPSEFGSTLTLPRSTVTDPATKPGYLPGAAP